MTPDARRLEELGLNSSAPPGQLLYDGWLLRLAPGKAKRARSVNAVYPSRLPLEAKISRCEGVYGAARLNALFRLTPFSEPAGLDQALEQRGYGRFEDTAVESMAITPEACAGAGAEAVPLRAWVEAVGELRGSPREHREGHLARLEGLPLELRAVAIRAGDRVVATGLVMVEDDCAGLFDIVTAEGERGRGHARSIVATLLGLAAMRGARHAYLQVAVRNEPARRLYRRCGFEERYRYWYRAREGEQS